MNTWTVTTSSQRRQRTIIGTAPTAEHARRHALAAAATMISRAGADEYPRYTLHLDDTLITIIQTGENDLGLPDHIGAAELLGHTQHTQLPYGS